MNPSFVPPSNQICWQNLWGVIQCSSEGPTILDTQNGIVFWAIMVLGSSIALGYISTKLVPQKYLLSNPDIRANLFVGVLLGSLPFVGHAWLKFLGGA